MRTRSRSPPMLMRGFMRSVWLLKPTTPSAGAGAAAQVPTQCLLPAIDSSLKSPVDGKSCRRERRRRNDFDEAVTLREPGRLKDLPDDDRQTFWACVLAGARRARLLAYSNKIAHPGRPLWRGGGDNC